MERVVMTVLVGLGLLVGCATVAPVKQVQKVVDSVVIEPTPVPALPTPLPTMVAVATPNRDDYNPTQEEYVSLRKGSCLWRLARERYGLGAMWPLIWRDNQIECANADVIPANTVLKVTYGQSHDDIEQAKGVAFVYGEIPAQAFKEIHAKAKVGKRRTVPSARR